MKNTIVKQQQFASDNCSGICPEAMQYLIESNKGHEYSYGEDHWTETACNSFREIFETDCEAFFVFTGTAANSLALASLCQSYHSIICQENSHIETDECGAPEFFSGGSKILLGKGKNGKLDPKSIEDILNNGREIHFPKPKVVSLTQATELGTVYTQAELLDIYKVTKRNNLRLHMDGARFANALVTLGVTPKEISWQCGIDVLCFGGVKNGLAVGEVILFFNKQLADDFAYRCKQSGQLSSKMRFLAAPWVGLLKDNTWLRNAKHANQSAAILESKIKEMLELKILYPREANAIFVRMPVNISEAMFAKGWHFYSFISPDIIRLMCSWNTTEESINEFIVDLKSCITKGEKR
jgi:threonine aldolase